MSVPEIPDAEHEADSTPDEQPVPVQTEGERVYDERANVPVTEVAERFLRAILLTVPLDRVEELHLFSPLRQGTTETGIAVIAARVVVPDTEVAPEPALELALEEGTAQVDAEPHADEPIRDVAPTLSPQPEPEPLPPAPRLRHTVYTARYRLVIKGPERGRWEMDVVDEADAPLLTVETVVRGVQRRAGEDTATVRYDSHQLARALRIVPTAAPAAGATGPSSAVPDAPRKGAV